MTTLTHAERLARRRKIAEYANSHTMEQAAQRFKVHEATVRAALRENNLPVRRRIPPSVSSFQILLRLLDGVLPKEIARELKITPQRVSQIKQQAVAAGFEFPISH